MAELIVLGAMIASAMIPFAAMARSMRIGKTGFALTVMSILGAILVILYFGMRTPIGLSPRQAMGWTLIFALPAVLGGSAGCFAGWLLRKRAERDQ